MRTRHGNRAVIYVPCDTFLVHVSAGLGDVLSPIEMTALRLIDALERDRGGRPGVTSVEQLVELLGLGHRVTLELLHDVWRKGYVRLDFSTGGVLVSEEVRTRIMANTLRELPGAETLDYDCEVMIDRLTGLVQPRRGNLAPGTGRLAVEPALDDTTPAQVPRAELIPALERDLHRRFTERAADGPDAGAGASHARQGNGRPPRVLSYRTPTDDAQITERRWIALDVLVHEDPDTGRLKIVVADRAYPASRHQLAGERLTQLAADNASSPFVRALRSVAGQDLIDPPPLERLLVRLHERADRAFSVPAATRLARHLELGDEARTVCAALDNRTASEVHAASVADEEHEARIVELIGQSRTQLVIAAPKITVTGWRRWEPELLRALEARVTVVLLWGEQPTAKLPSPVHNALVSLVRRYGPGRLLYPQVAPCPEANVVIQDDQAALISDRDIMGYPAGHSLGLLLTAPDEDSHSVVFGRLLSWAAGIVPTARMSRLLRTTGDAFGTGQPALPESLGFPEAPPEEAEAPERAVRAWADGWVAYARALAERAASRELPAARIVDTDAHVDLLWRALRSARCRLVISSDRPPSVDDRFVTLLDGRLREGVWVTLGLAVPPGQEPAELVRLAAEYPGRLRLVPARGRVLVHDDEVLVGGKDLLGEGGRGAWRGRPRPAPGIVLTSVRAADELAAAVGEPPEVAALVRRQEKAPAESGGTDPRVVYARQRIVTNWRPDAEGAALLRTELGRSQDPWAVLEDLDGTTGPDLVTAAAACCLLHHAAAASAEISAHWRLRLVRLCWGRGDYTRAALLRRSVADPAARPRMPLAAVAAARGGRQLGTHLLEVAVGTDPDSDEQAALMLVAVEEVLRTGDDLALDVVVELAAGLGAPWEELGRAVHRCHQELYGLPAGPEIRRALSDERHQEARDAQWQALEQALLVADRPPVIIKPAIRTHHVLFRDDRLFGRIRTLVSGRDPDGLGALLAKETGTGRRHGDGRAVAADLVDDVWRGVSHVRDEPLTGAPRENYLSKLGEVLDLAWRVAAAEPGPEPGDHRIRGPHDPLEAVRELGRVMVDRRGRTQAAVAELAEPERGLCHSVLDGLADLYRLGAAHSAAADEVEQH
ncbi:hypothetical protein ACH4HG_09350 [Streptomyces coeruleorubidus]|uniref:Uncharacterized protein n=1 Tax=Streptomyces coeruleorubidus TaxID=116188 RepID=A0ABZ0KDX2_STRC4|nr:hypothetical protein [Streptomyces coeruleorubidus]WOT36190.1 hypothetical protein R5U08_19600 [Streptomyces coeruleorubidus]